MKGVSVIIPTYNREQFITEAILSVINQEYDGTVEIIISDDGSSDKTLEIAETFGDKVLILKKSQNCLTQGVSSTRNRGIKASSQPYICFLDSDDFFLPGHLKKIVSSLEYKPDLDFAFCRILEIKEQNGIRSFKAWTKPEVTSKDIINPAVSGNNVVCTNVFIFQKYIFDRIGGFNENYRSGEDSDMWMRISEQFKGTFADYFGAVRRKHEYLQITTSLAKKVSHKNHLNVYRDAIKRYHQLGIKDFYRIYRLRILTFKYTLGRIGLFDNIHKLLISKKINKTSNGWYDLSHFM